MILMLVLAALGVAGLIGSVFVTVKDSKGRMPAVWGYNSRRPWF